VFPISTYLRARLAYHYTWIWGKVVTPVTLRFDDLVKLLAAFPERI
jgi:hypothetical protein